MSGSACKRMPQFTWWMKSSQNPPPPPPPPLPPPPPSIPSHALSFTFCPPPPGSDITLNWGTESLFFHQGGKKKQKSIKLPKLSQSVFFSQITKLYFEWWRGGGGGRWEWEQILTVVSPWLPACLGGLWWWLFVPRGRRFILTLFSRRRDVRRNVSVTHWHTSSRQNLVEAVHVKMLSVVTPATSA